MSALLFAATAVLALLAFYARHDARKAAQRATADRYRAKDAANAAKYAANIGARWQG